MRPQLVPGLHPPQADPRQQQLLLLDLHCDLPALAAGPAELVVGAAVHPLPGIT